MMFKRQSLMLSAALILVISSLTLAAGPLGTASVANAAGSACDLTEAVLVGTNTYGLNCLDKAGWHAYTREDTKLPSNVAGNVVVCSDGVAWFPGALDFSSSKDLLTWTPTAKPSFSSASAMACAKPNDIWVAHFQGVSHFDGKAWTTTDYKELGSGATANLVKEVAVAPDGKVWAVTSNSVASYDGKAWTVYEKGKGFDKDYFFDGLAVDSKSNVYVGHGQGVWTYDGKEWKQLTAPDLQQVQAVAVDSKGQLWAGTFAKGVQMYDGKKWTGFTKQSAKLTSDQVRTLAVDGQDRVWAGLDYGLAVYDGKEWTSFHMHTSDLLDNSVFTVVAVGKGPALPAKKEKKPGTIIGTIRTGRDNVVGAKVELCSDFVPSIFRGATPCADHAYTQLVETDKEGNFTFKDVPVGRYGFVVQGPDKGWIRFIGADSKIEVNEGEETDLEVIDIGKTK